MLERVQADANAALKAGDKKTADALRMLYSALKNAQIAAGGKLSEDEAIIVVKKAIKQRIEARDIFAANGREEQAAQEEFERSLYSQYAPAELSVAQIDEIIERVAKDVNDTTFAKIMPLVMRESRGNADGKTVSERVRNYVETRA